MAGSPQPCPKCSHHILVFTTDPARHVVCPKCRTLLQISPRGLDVAKPAKPRAKVSKPPPEPAPSPPVEVGPSPGAGLVVAAFSALGVVIIAGIIGSGILLWRPEERPAIPWEQSLNASSGQALPRDRRSDERKKSDAGSASEDAASVKQGAEKRTPGERTDSDPKEGSPASNPFATSGPSVPASLASAVAGVRHSVVTITNDEGGQGSGFVVQKREWVATNFHVVAGNLRGTAQRKRDESDDWIEINIKGFVACDPGKDLVILALEKDWPADPLLLSRDAPRLGEDVFAVGAPKGLTETITRGIVSQVRSAADVGYESLSPSTKIIQTDAFFTNGSSGGPLCSAEGKVIGITSFGLQQDEQSAEFHFAIAAEELAVLLGKASNFPRPLTELPPARD